MLDTRYPILRLAQQIAGAAFAKRQRDLAKKQKKEEKRLRKQKAKEERDAQAPTDEDVATESAAPADEDAPT